MEGKRKRPLSSAKVRHQAGEMALEEAAKSPSRIDVLSLEESRLMLHELRVHQIELEMQNDELRRVQVELDAARASYFDLYDLAPVGYWTLNEKGLILRANLTAATLLGVARSQLMKQLFTRFIHREDQDIYYLHRKLLLEATAPPSCEVRMLKSDGTPFQAHLAASTGQDAEGSTLLRIVVMPCHQAHQAHQALRSPAAAPAK